MRLGNAAHVVLAVTLVEVVGAGGDKPLENLRFWLTSFSAIV